jgi:hypothetical protein
MQNAKVERVTAAGIVASAGGGTLEVNAASESGSTCAMSFLVGEIQR